MNNKLNALYLSGSLALSFLMTTPVRADEWNKRTELEFSAPVEVPGKVLAAGKYVFELAESGSDRSIVQVFSEDSNGNESLIATIFAVPDYMSDTPDKTIINFEERHSGSPEAIHSWFYPGDNTGVEFIYPKGESLEASATTPAPTPVATAAAPTLPPAPQIQDETLAPDVDPMEEDVFIAQNDAPAAPAAQEAPAPPPAQDTDTPNSDNRVLPQTGGSSDLELMAGLAMLGGGIAAVFASRRKYLA